MVSVKFIVEEEMLLPAGTRIEIDTNYDWSRSVQFNNPGHNPAVKVFEAEAARDSAVTQAVVGGLVTGAGIGFGADLLKTAIKRAGSTSLTNAQDGTLTVSGGLGDRQLARSVAVGPLRSLEAVLIPDPIQRLARVAAAHILDHVDRVAAIVRAEVLPAPAIVKNRQRRIPVRMVRAAIVAAAVWLVQPQAIGQVVQVDLPLELLDVVIHGSSERLSGRPALTDRDLARASALPCA